MKLLHHKHLRSTKGFTFLEMLVALAIISLSFLLISIGVKNIQALHLHQYEDKQLEWHLFLNQWKAYLKEEDFKAIYPTYLESEIDGVKVLYEQPRTNSTVFIRRKSGGNQRLLSGIEDLSIKKASSHHLIQVDFQTGERYEAFVPIATPIMVPEKNTDQDELKDADDHPDDEEDEEKEAE